MGQRGEGGGGGWGENGEQGGGDRFEGFLEDGGAEAFFSDAEGEVGG